MEGNKCIYLVSHLFSSLNSYLLAFIFNFSNQFPNYSFLSYYSCSCYHKHVTQIQCY